MVENTFPSANGLKQKKRRTGQAGFGPIRCLFTLTTMTMFRKVFQIRHHKGINASVTAANINGKNFLKLKCSMAKKGA